MIENKTNDQIEDLSRQLSIVFASFIETFQNNVQDQFLKPFSTMTVEIKHIVENALSPFKEPLAEFLKGLPYIIANLACSLEKLPERNREALRILAGNCWYMDPEFSLPDLLYFASKFSLGNIEEGHNELCDYFESRMDEIEAGFIKHLPTRSKILCTAIQAHKRREYALSIPVFLSQADGVCSDITGIQLYCRDHGVPKLASVPLLSNMSPILSPFLTPLIEPMPISANQNDRAKMLNILNHHAILHGVDLDYDTRLNSFRAISLLVYVSWILQKNE